MTASDVKNSDIVGLDREFVLPEISTRLRFPAGEAIGFHFVDGRGDRRQYR
jgi:hypothetical protein